MPAQLYRCPNYAANYNNMRLKNKWCDLTIIVNEKKYRAHKLVLAANLKYFDTMLSRDSFQASMDGVITMKCVDEASMEAFITYAYTGRILLTDSNVLDLLEAANYFSEDGIKEACINFLKAHLTVDQACRAYKFAGSIDCLTLKNAAKKTILSNFGRFSETNDFLDFECGQLVEILSDGQSMPAESQREFFEKIMRWIMHDVEERSNRMEDLLNAIDIAKLTADDLLGYLLGNVVDSHDDRIVGHVMVCYHKKKIQQRKVQAATAEQSFMAIGRIDEKWQFQLCNLSKKKFTPKEEFRGACCISQGAVLNDMLYYIGADNPIMKRGDLYVFNPVTKRSTKLHSPSNIRGSALCASSKFVYSCGGSIDDVLATDRALRYDPETYSFETLPRMTTKRWAAAAIFYQGCVYVLGGYGNSVEKYDPDKKTWTVCPSMCESRQVHAVAELDGKLYVCGGILENSVEVYDPSTNSWRFLASMNKQRWVFLVVAHEGKLLAIGGIGEKTVEVYDPLKDEWQMDDELSSGFHFQYIRGGLMSASGITKAA